MSKSKLPNKFSFVLSSVFTTFLAACSPNTISSENNLSTQPNAVPTPTKNLEQINNDSENKIEADKENNDLDKNNQTDDLLNKKDDLNKDNQELNNDYNSNEINPVIDDNSIKSLHESLNETELLKNNSKRLEIAKKISEKTVSINFIYTSKSDNENEIKIYTSSGTGWIYDIDESKNNFYIATNLHVAKFASYNNKKINNNQMNENFASFDKLLLSYINFVPLNYLNNDNKNLVEKNNLGTVFTSIPEVVYTTINDENFNNQFTKPIYGLKGKNEFSQYKGVADFAILKFNFPQTNQSYSDKEEWLNRNSNFPVRENKDNDIKNFIDWLNNAKKSNETIKVSSQYYDDIKSKIKGYYMAGFPFHEKTKAISWQNYSDFERIQSDDLEFFEKSWEYSQNINQTNKLPPITYFDNFKSKENDFTSFNFINVARHLYFNVSSFSGASGSPLIADVDGNLEVIGIYWGTVDFLNNKKYGAIDVFNNNFYGKKYSLFESVNKTIENDKKITKSKTEYSSNDQNYINGLNGQKIKFEFVESNMIQSEFVEENLDNLSLKR